MLNILDCADCQDCSEAEIHIYEMQSAEWSQLATDLEAIHNAQLSPTEKTKAAMKEADRLHDKRKDN
jgi:hypothetical protein